MTAPNGLAGAYWPTQHSESLFGRSTAARPVVRTVLDRDEPLFVALVHERGYTPAGHPHRDQATTTAAAEPTPVPAAAGDQESTAGEPPARALAVVPAAAEPTLAVVSS